MTNPVAELKRRTVGISQRLAAKQLGVSQQYLNDVLRLRKEPGAKILDALGLERVVTYRWKLKG